MGGKTMGKINLTGKISYLKMDEWRGKKRKGREKKRFRKGIEDRL